ncbi:MULTISPECIES: hypothetical protein [Halopseudomonas]|jgi:hypothetical protein|nr:hypothetical protein [Halopseudomonas aestusnigri]
MAGILIRSMTYNAPMVINSGALGIVTSLEVLNDGDSRKIQG